MRDDLVPAGRWRFDQPVADRFDDMLRRSIPDHDGMRQLVTDLAAPALVPGAVVLDLGTSRGEAIARLRPDLHPACRFVGLDASPEMVAAAAARHAGSPNVDVLEHDLAGGLPAAPPVVDVALAVLTLMFLPGPGRYLVLEQLRARMTLGGLLVVVEKVRPPAWAADQLRELYHGHKRRQGYTAEQVDAKAAALAGVLVPWTETGTVGALEHAGFDVAPVWRWGPFAGWIAQPT